MYDLSQFTLGDLTTCGAVVRKLGAGAQSLEETAQRLVRHFHEEMRDRSGGHRACALVRLFKTHPFDDLEPDLQTHARQFLDGEPRPGLRCWTLLASAGDRPEWNDRRGSQRHQVMPLASLEMLERLPMLAQLVGQFGLEPGALLQPDPSLLGDLAPKTCNVFHVAQAPGSPFVPAQEEFVVPCGVESVLGFGGLLPGGDLFALILFARVAISRETADLFKTLALSAKLALLPFARGPIFAGRTAEKENGARSGNQELVPA